MRQFSFESENTSFFVRFWEALLLSQPYHVNFFQRESCQCFDVIWDFLITWLSGKSKGHALVNSRWRDSRRICINIICGRGCEDRDTEGNRHFWQVLTPVSSPDVMCQLHPPVHCMGPTHLSTVWVQRPWKRYNCNLILHSIHTAKWYKCQTGQPFIRFH